MKINESSRHYSPIDGILLVNKPQGLTSNALLQRVKRIFNVKKAGHTGSLDPLATGMLPLCFGEGTKFSQYLLDADKCYQATGLLGIQTSTGDSLGEITRQVNDFSISQSQLMEVLTSFLGQTLQVPSMFSALKHQGVPLYKYAREGKVIEREARPITVYTLKLLHFDGRQFTIEIKCSKGTYIRNLVEDIGCKLGVGAHVIQLHRLYTAGFDEEVMHSLHDLEESTIDNRCNFLLPVDRMVASFPALFLKENEVLALRQGKQIITSHSPASSFRLYDEAKCFIGLGEQQGNILKVKRLLTSVKLDHCPPNVGK